ncbi:hypothetical protein GGX14DRAFT_565563 [Mycena pura]|uniref:Uncharacterized protein n=1 Tax=Mycena pura TaxID=153505 RepID=A0AAD6VI62_9AGAR|nr:hypothetical protein GGX14DRAFT_565563 [Mycena pura]
MTIVFSSCDNLKSRVILAWQATDIRPRASYTPDILGHLGTARGFTFPNSDAGLRNALTVVTAGLTSLTALMRLVQANRTRYGAYVSAADAADRFISSIRLVPIDILVEGYTMTGWNVYVDSPTDNYAIWDQICNTVAALLMHTPLNGTGRITRHFQCRICFSLDHPTPRHSRLAWPHGRHDRRPRKYHPGRTREGAQGAPQRRRQRWTIEWSRPKPWPRRAWGQGKNLTPEVSFLTEYIARQYLKFYPICPPPPFPFVTMIRTLRQFYVLLCTFANDEIFCLPASSLPRT